MLQAHMTYLTCAEETSMQYLLHAAGVSSNNLVRASTKQFVHHSHLMHRPLWTHESHALLEDATCAVEDLPCTANFCLKVCVRWNQPVYTMLPITSYSFSHISARQFCTSLCCVQPHKRLTMCLVVPMTACLFQRTILVKH